MWKQNKGERVVVLEQPAVLAARVGAVPHGGAGGGVHQEAAWRDRRSRALAWRMAMNSPART